MCYNINEEEIMTIHQYKIDISRLRAKGSISSTWTLNTLIPELKRYKFTYLSALLFMAIVMERDLKK